AMNIRSVAPQGIFIFLMPPSMEELERRLTVRNTESGSPLELRLQAAYDEIQQLSIFDYVVVNHNDRLDQAASTIESIVLAEKCRIPPRKVVL
ncbi:MAG: guanylate kinase, partial [Chloroflexi bacterium]|nr:guanylate kinase [Chloroflexota bacterium]